VFQAEQTRSAEQHPDGQPLITAIVASYNEEEHIEACLRGLLCQEGLPGAIEILVVDGGSTDDTVQIIKKFPEFGQGIRVIENPRRFQVYAWNLGIRAARGRYVALFSAHTEYSSDYLAKCLEARERTGAGNVGGVQVPVGEGLVARAFAWAMQTPFGVGNARFRFADKEQFVDAVFGIFLDRATIDVVGGFDESIPFNEDSEFNYRLRRAGYKVFLSPQIRVRYHVRSSLRRIAQQMYRNGFWRRRTQLIHPDYVPVRVLAPPLLVVATIISCVGFALTKNPLALSVPILYVGFLLVAMTVALLQTRSAIITLTVPAVLAVMHFAFGLGWLVGLAIHRVKH
jgi:succinoglycan biosynthesis protein ExoA